jgi:Holliday junction resolvase RusA-like endonuclease
MKEIRELWRLAGEPTVDAEWFTATVVAQFQEPRTTKHSYPPRTDVDNIAKLVLDSLQECAFPNDSRCRSLTVSKEWAQHDCLVVTLSW